MGVRAGARHCDLSLERNNTRAPKHLPFFVNDNIVKMLLSRNQKHVLLAETLMYAVTELCFAR